MSVKTIAARLGSTVGALAAIGALLLAMACAAGTQPTATPTTTPTPKTAYWPTFGDYVRVVGALYKGSAQLGLLELTSLDLAVFHAASECVAGRELSLEGFRASLSQSYPNLPFPDSTRNTVLIGQMLALARTGARLDCLRPYLYPENSAETILALDLAYPFSNTLRWSGPIFFDSAERQAYVWLASKEEQREPLLQVIALGNVQISAQITVPKNTAGLPIQAWALERERWRLRVALNRK